MEQHFWEDPAFGLVRIAFADRIACYRNVVEEIVEVEPVVTWPSVCFHT